MSDSETKQTVRLDSRTMDIVVNALAVLLVLGSIGMVGHFNRSISLPERGLFLVAALCVIVPLNSFDGAHEANLVALVLGVALLTRQFLGRRVVR